MAEQTNIKLPDDIMQEPEYIQKMRSEYKSLSSDIDQQIESIRSRPDAVDTDKLVGNLESSFSNLRNQLTSGALRSTELAGIEMDSYFGSPTSDQRSAARVGMAASIKNNMLKTAFDSIAGLYMQQIEKVVSTELAGAELNLQDRASRATEITGLIGEATRSFLGTYDNINLNYNNRLNAAIDYINIESQNRRSEAEIEFKQDALYEEGFIWANGVRVHHRQFEAPTYARTWKSVHAANRELAGNTREVVSPWGRSI